MTKIAVFIDTNVFIGSYRKLSKDINCLNFLYQERGVKLYTSSLVVSQIIAKLSKSKGKWKESNISIINKVKKILKNVYILPFDETDIENSLETDVKDLEDNIQYHLSQKIPCTILVTNNVKDYKFYSNITVLKPSEIRGAIQ